MAGEERLGGASGSSPVPGRQQQQKQRVKETGSRRQRVGEARPANSFLLLTTNLSSSNHSDDKAVTLLIYPKCIYGRVELDNRLLTSGFYP